ncbi:ABC transporter permease [Cryobacterium sp. SO2]|uniref:ABC transporter permease n=1 Tax=Cryobacterium sp. SO2 TaxID=1897060 RepID=UPI00223E05E9|nr:ABC transporter permease [Cryobacterium sp. SO2]WEO75802.1 ABC transporter permease [Cryobacterium sp. SO2]
MQKLILTRIASLAGVMLVLSLAVFFIQRLIPADPVRALVGRTASPEVVAAARVQLGLDDPFFVQYARFLGNLVLHGDLGNSLRTRNPVATDIGAFLPATLELVLVATVLALVGGLVLGILSSRSGWLSSVIRFVTVAGSSSATFLVGILAILVLYRNLGWFPAGGRSETVLAPGPTGFLLVDTLLAGNPAGWLDALRHLLLPAAVLALGPTVAIGRTLRGSLRTVMQADFIRSAHAKGFTWSAVTARHALRNSVNPALSMAGLQIGLLFSGSVIVETIFSWPGVGGYMSKAIGASDFPAIVGVVLVLGGAYVLINFVVDMLQLVIDPRLRSTS